MVNSSWQRERFSEPRRTEYFPAGTSTQFMPTSCASAKPASATYVRVDHETERELDITLIGHRLLIESILERDLPTLEETCTEVSLSSVAQKSGQLIFHFGKDFRLSDNDLDEGNDVVSFVPPQ